MLPQNLPLNLPQDIPQDVPIQEVPPQNIPIQPAALDPMVQLTKSCAASVRSREAHQVSLRDSQLATSGSKPHWHYNEDLGGLYTQRSVT